MITFPATLFRSSIYSLSFVFIFFASCTGQIKTNTQNENIQSNPNEFVEGKQSKMGSSMLEDKAGNIWFTSNTDGVYRFDGKKFINFTEKDGLGSNYVYCLMEDQSGHIWAGTADGASYYDGNKFTPVPITEIKINHPVYRKTEIDSYGVPYPSENYVWSLMQDRSGVIWFGTFDEVYLYDGKIFTLFSENNGILNLSGVPVKGIESMFEDRAGNVWLGGRGSQGIYRYDGNL